MAVGSPALFGEGRGDLGVLDDVGPVFEDPVLAGVPCRRRRRAGSRRRRSRVSWPARTALITGRVSSGAVCRMSSRVCASLDEFVAAAGGRPGRFVAVRRRSASCGSTARRQLSSVPFPALLGDLLARGRAPGSVTWCRDRQAAMSAAALSQVASPIGSAGSGPDELVEPFGLGAGELGGDARRRVGGWHGPCGRLRRGGSRAR